jgi:hypothetical protein
MEARVGDRLVMEGKKVGQAPRSGEVVRVEGTPSRPRYWVRWDDGHESLVTPAAGVRVEPRHA